MAWDRPTWVIFTCLTCALALGLFTRTVQAQCDDPLGFENGNITDDQLSATSSLRTYTADQARLNVGRGWSGGSSGDPYLEVDLLTQHQVIRYSIQGSKRRSYSRTVALFYSLDRLVWERYVSSDGKDTLEGNTNYNSVRSFNLTPPVKARYLAFQPISKYDYPSLRLELYGCEVDQPVPVTHTVVTKDIEDTQEWIPSQSPYVLNNVTNIRPSGHVKVQPGVKIVFNSSAAGLVVLGTLETNGLDGLPVVFSTTLPGITVPGKWKGVEVLSQGNLTLEHCDIHGAESGIKGPLSSITVRYCHIHHNNIGIDLSMGDRDPGRTQIAATRIMNNKNRGIFGSKWEDGQNAIGLSHCKISGNREYNFYVDREVVLSAENTEFSYGDYGIFHYYYGIDLTLKSCSFLHTNQAGIYLNYIRVMERFNITIGGSQFRNKRDGIRLSVQNPPKGSTFSITNSNFTDNGEEAIELNGEYIRNPYTVFIQNNTFASTTTTRWYLVNLKGYRIYSDTKFVIESNSFFTRQALWLVGESFLSHEIGGNTFNELSGNQGIRIQGGHLTMTNNVFSNCTTHTVASIQTLNTTVHGNAFLNPEATFDLLVDLPFTERVRLNASHNYWGNSDKFYVRSRICDFFCDITKMIGDVHPFYTTESMTELSNEIDSDLFSFQNAVTIGGILTESVRLDPHQILFVNRTLYIPEEYSMTIPENVTLVFPHRQGIFVKGVLEIQGQQGAEVVLTNNRTDKMNWGGLVFNSTGSTIRYAHLKKPTTGIQLNINNTGTFIITDSIITQTKSAVSGKLWGDVSLFLHRVAINESSKVVDIEKMSNNTVTVNFDQSNMSGETYLHSNVQNGHFNVSCTSSKFLGGRSFSIQSCRNNITMNVYDSTFISGSSHTIDVDGGPLNVLMRNTTASGYGGLTSFMICSLNNVHAGVIEIQDSSFSNTGYSYALAIEARYGFNSPHTVLLMNNSFHTSRNYAGLYINKRLYSNPWNIAAIRNTFTKTGIDLYGSISEATFEENTFHGTSTVFRSNIDTINVACITTLKKNLVQGGSLTLYSKRVDDMFHLSGNVFNGSTIILKTPNTTIHENMFFSGSEFDIKFEGNGHAGKEINCTFNYWNTTEKKVIDRRLYDSSYDEKLPEINFVPFYEFPNLTNPLYPKVTFVSADGTIGGKVGGNVTLTRSGSPYVVTANIEVGKLETLIIEAGVQLLLPKGIGIVVHGTFKVLGNSTHPVEARALVIGQKWSGVVLRRHVYQPSGAASNIRLVGGKDEREGRVEVKINGTWGTVCDDGFDRADANVICRMLGFDSLISNEAFNGRKFGQGSGPILYGNLRCTGFENTLNQCKSTEFSCNHYEDAGVRCNGMVLPKPEEIGNEVLLHYFQINDTENGIEMNGNITSAKGISSTYSNTNGITVHAGFQGVSTLNIEGIEASHNKESGLTFTAKQHISYESEYLQIITSDCDMHSNGKHGIHVRYDVNISIVNCRFKKNKNRAIYLGNNAIVDINLSMFSQNRGVFGHTDSYYNRLLKLNIRDSLILHHDMRRYRGRQWYFYNRIIEIFSRSGKDTVYSFVNNHFSGNIGHILYFDLKLDINQSVIIENNTFKDNNASITSVDPPASAGMTYYFVNNTVENNTVPDFIEPLVKIAHRPNSNGSHVKIVHNRFLNNIAPEIVNLLNIRKLETNLSITRNTFLSNNCTATVKTTVFGITLLENIFNNNLSRCELEAPVFERWYDIDARWNYWGSKAIGTVFSKICGFDSQMGRSFVHYLPFYLTEDFNSETTDVQTDFWISNLHGGVVDGTLRLEKKQSPYHIRRSVFIRENGVLEIEGGVQLKFRENTGIYTDGVLQTDFTSEKVILTRDSNVPWFGLVFPYKTAEVSQTVRLVNGSKANEGRVEMFVNGSWSTVCNMDNTDAVLVCKALGYGSKEARIQQLRLEWQKGQEQSILYDLGCDDSMPTLSDCRPTMDNNRYCDHKDDYWLTCNEFVAYTGIHKFSYLENVSILGSNKGIILQTPTLRLSNCHINNTMEAGLTLDNDAIDLDLNGTIVEHGDSDGLYVKVSKNLRILNGTTQNNRGNGITLSTIANQAVIERMNIINNGKHGLETSNVYKNKDTNIVVKHNVIKDHVHNGFGLKLNARFYTNFDNFLTVERNEFINNIAGSIDMPLRSDAYYTNKRNVIIRTNNFLSSGNVSIYAEYYIPLIIENNIATNCTGGSECFFSVNIKTINNKLNYSVAISTNTFEDTRGKCAVYLKSADYYNLNGVFNYNQIYSSSTNDAAVILDSSNFTFSNNIFDNPRTNYELKVEKTGPEEIKAENNWWGTTNPIAAGARILHKDQDQRLLRVDYLPILTDKTFDCSAVHNCSGTGECVRPNGCRCQPGWAGADCSDFDCSGVGNCHGNGVCIGPNLCNCTAGWKGSSCVLATCHEVKNCSGYERGYCVLPNRCTCFPQYSGDDCSQCAALRWGPSCLSCPRCLHGACNTTNGQCVCDSENWSGELCDTCSETFYGPNCLPFINILNIIPSSGPDTGDTEVHIWGHNFPQTVDNIFYCRFDRTVVNGTRISKGHVKCKSPQHVKGDVFVEISSDGQEFTRNQTKFTYYEVCPPGACGKTLTPPHGHCLYGGCVCTLPWSGENCNIELVAPVVSLDSDTQAVAEGDEYRLQPKLSQGSAPIDWFLIRAPAGMMINARNGSVFWERTVANREPYVIIVKASNRIGHSQVVLSLTVPLSYNVTIDELIPSGTLSVPKPIQIRGHVNFHSETSRSLIAFVDVKIRNKGKIVSSMSAVTSPRTPDRFEAVYYPKAGASGLFEVDGRHPSDSGFTGQRSWRVLGMKCVPGYTSRQAYLEDTPMVEMRGVTVLKNGGVDQIKNITVTVEGLGYPLTDVVVRVNNVLSSDVSRPLIDSLDPGTEATVDLILTASSPLRGIISVVFNTTEGTTARVRVQLQLNVRRPVLIPSSRSLRDSITRATMKTFQINITNEGEVPANGLRVTLPSEPRLAVSAFSNSSSQSSEAGLDLQPDETAILILTVTAGPDDALGEFSGSIALNSDLASTSISYRFYVTSLEKLNVTVRVEDEFTYFASDKPLVSGATVTLRNQLKGYNEKIITNNETGFVVFEDIHEDRYTLQATAPGHSSYSAVIIAKPSESSFSIFLQRVAVIYTWTVTPTTFEDKYIITLDSTFETQVPMPVVTVEPANINIIPYEEGKKDIINFNITNHGLIRADNARFIIPTDHPSLIFTQTIDPIGAVDANTSIIVPVLVQVKSRVKRSAATIACGLKMLYDYFCGQTRTGGQDITLSRQYPGRPPLPCRTGGGSGGGGGGGGYVGISGTGGGSSRPSSSVVVYKPVTPLSCDCAGTLIKDCILGFNPFAGCALATVGLSGNTGFVDNALAGLNFGFACILTPLSAVCPWCGLAATLWQAGSCIVGVNSNCNSKRRRRRAANSEVIQGLIDSNVAMQNYLILMKEIYGGEEMFDVYDNSWMNSFKLALTEDSVAGQFLSQSEVTSITAPLNTSLVQAVKKFLSRWNNTITAWEDGTLATLGPKDNVISYNIVMTRSEQFRNDNKNAKKRGFDSIFDDFDNAVSVYKEKEKKGDTDEGVCAKVRVRIVQELVLTRDAFNARLEIENGEQSALENIAVTVNIRPTYGDGKYTTDKFSIGNPTLVGITAVDGSGRLEQDVSGTAEWLIIPYSTAAVKEDTLYDVGGTLSYRVGGSNFSIPLLPDTITVKPNPSLILNYFHEKYVQGDDPMTADVTEPVVPFTLAVMVSNGAYGVARQLKITSAQPEIIENEKGLLVSFKIIGAQLGKDPVTPSLSINFGDIESFETKTARWMLTSSLRGKFYNFTATFENINPLGDPQLSIIEHLGYHELIHLVRLESTGDEMDDFLVNDVVDEDEMADAVYDSSNGFYSLPVVSSAVTKFSLRKRDTIGNRTYTYIALTVSVSSQERPTYFYTRLVNNLTRDSISESLLQVTRDDNKHILVGSNAWLTNYYHDSFYLHIFDFVSDLNGSIIYSLVFGPMNMYNPVFTEDVYEIEVSKSQTPGFVYDIKATDKDPNSTLRYLLQNNTILSINENTGELRSTATLDTGVYAISVIVSDDGIPSRSNSAKIILTITDGPNIPTTAMPTPTTTKEGGVSSSVGSSSSSPILSVSSTLDSVIVSSSPFSVLENTTSSSTDSVVSSSSRSTSTSEYTSLPTPESSTGSTSSSLPASSSTPGLSEGPDRNVTSPPTTSTQAGSTENVSKAANLMPVISILTVLTGMAFAMIKV